MSKPRDIGGGRFVLTRTENFVHWCAWRYWLHREVGRTFFPEKLCVWSEWPPESMAMAQIVCQAIAASRKKIGWDFQVCDPAQPWDRWGYAECEDLLRRHREDFLWNPTLAPPRGFAKPGPHKTAVEKELDDWIIAEAAKKPSIPKGEWEAFVASKKRAKNWADRPPMPYIESTPEQIAERLAALKRRGIEDNHNDDPRNDRRWHTR